MIPFRHRNPVPIGAISLVVILLLLVAGFKAGDLPLIGGGTTYYANFSEAGGLKPNDEVRIAGVRVGKVTKVDLAGNKVRVTFKIKSSNGFGPRTEAQIKVKTLLGNMFMALVPAGQGQMADGATIPVSRTTSPYSVVDVFSGLAARSEKMNVKRLGQAIDTIAGITRNTPAAFRGTLRGLSALSTNVAARNEELGSLLQHTRRVSRILSARSNDIVGLMQDSDVLMRALVARRVAIHRLLVSTSVLSGELVKLVNGTRADLRPALAQLQGVTNLLLKNQANLDTSLRLLAPFYRVFANTLGQGPWFDDWISNMPPVPSVGG